MVATLLAVSGASSSGKSTLVNTLLRNLGGEGRAFGKVVEIESLARGRTTQKPDLQRTGMELIEEGWPAFVGRVLTPPPLSDLIVVDGIRHRAAIEELSLQLPLARVVHVHVQTAREALEVRTRARGEDKKLLDHVVESELPEVALFADITVSGETDTAQGVETIREFLRRG